MILQRIVNQALPPVPLPAIPASPILERATRYWGEITNTGRRVSPETAKKVATAYRCANIISDDIGSMPLQLFQQIGRNARRVQPNVIVRNIAYLLEVAPNRWHIPLIFKKTAANWLIFWGNAYIWQPPTRYRELFILAADRTWPIFDEQGELWYETTFPSGKQERIPGVEILHLMINSDDGLIGKSVLTHARNTIGRQLGAHETQDKIQGEGLRPSAAITMNGDLNPDARNKVRDEYKTQMQASGVAVFDAKVSKFEAVTIKPTDAQFLEGIEATDTDIANFFGVPLYKLNHGKQSYDANAQQDLDYLKSTLNPYLIQWEQAARVKWLSEFEQESMYFRFIREAILQTDAKTRAEYLKNLIESGQLTPNEGRQINDMPAYDGGDAYYFPANMARILPDGNLSGVNSGETQA